MKSIRFVFLICMSLCLFSCNKTALLSVGEVSVNDVSAMSAKCSFSVDSLASFTDCGVCWDVADNPTTQKAHISSGNKAGDFTVTIAGLNENTKYYVRAYVVSGDVKYSKTVTFTTKTLPSGVVKGLFSVSEDKQVLFSQGNLQYQASTNTWRFAENQFDFVGDNIRGNVMENGEKCDNALIASDYAGWIDLFGWGTSGWNNGNKYYHPYDYFHDSTWIHEVSGYGPVLNNSHLCNLYGDTKNADWGVYNSIVNGGNQPNQWRTMTKDEWMFLTRKRKDAS